jgi:hypothetical protein
MSQDAGEPSQEPIDPPEPEAQLLVWSSFLVRLWREAHGEWRGRATHLETRETRQLTSLVEILAFLSEHTPGLEIQN